MHMLLCTRLHAYQGRRQDFCFEGANLAATGSPAGSAVPGIARGVWGHAPPENFEILGCLQRILRQVETVVKCLQLQLLIVCTFKDYT